MKPSMKRGKENEMPDPVYEEILKDTNKVAADIQAETHFKKGLLEKKYRVRVHSEDCIAIVDAENEEDAIEKYYNEEVEEWETDPNEQPDITAEPAIEERKLTEQEETFDIFYEDLQPHIKQQLLKWLGVSSPEEGNLEYNPIAVVSKPEEEAVPEEEE